MCLKDVWDNGRCNLQGLATMIPTDIVHYIHQLPAPNNLDVRLQDVWTWRHAKKGEYTCSSGYYWLLQQNRDWNVNCNMNWLWRLKVPAKLQHFLWLCFHEYSPYECMSASLQHGSFSKLHPLIFIHRGYSSLFT